MPAATELEPGFCTLEAFGHKKSSSHNNGGGTTFDASCFLKGVWYLMHLTGWRRPPPRSCPLPRDGTRRSGGRRWLNSLYLCVLFFLQRSTRVSGAGQFPRCIHSKLPAASPLREESARRGSHSRGDTLGQHPKNRFPLLSGAGCH